MTSDYNVTAVKRMIITSCGDSFLSCQVGPLGKANVEVHQLYQDGEIPYAKRPISDVAELLQLQVSLLHDTMQVLSATPFG